MSKFAEPMSRLIDELKKLPGVGSKSAQRYAFHILRGTDEDAEALAGAIREIKAALRLCSVCNNITDVDPCDYCSSPTRNQRLVCVVEEPTNIAALEKGHGYHGVYHVLHGTLSPIHGVGPEHLRISNLLRAGGERRGRRGDSGDQSHRGRRGDGRVSGPSAEAERSAGDADRHRHSGRQRHRIRR